MGRAGDELGAAGAGRVGRPGQRGPDVAIEGHRGSAGAVAGGEREPAPVRRGAPGRERAVEDGVAHGVVGRADVERRPGAPGDDVHAPRLGRERPDGRRRPRAANGLGLGRQAELRRTEQRVGASRHRRRARVAGAADQRHVDVRVAGDGRDDPERTPGILEDATLLDVRLDPRDEAVERPRAVAPARRVAAGVRGDVPERATVVERADLRAQLGLADVARREAAAEQQPTEAGALLLEPRDHRERQAEAELGIQAGKLERHDDAERPVPRSAAAHGVQVRADPDARRAGRHVAGDERPERRVAYGEAEGREAVGDPADRPRPLRRVGVPADRGRGGGERRPGERPHVGGDAAADRARAASRAGGISRAGRGRARRSTAGARCAASTRRCAAARPRARRCPRAGEPRAALAGAFDERLEPPAAATAGR